MRIKAAIIPFLVVLLVSASFAGKWGRVTFVLGDVKIIRNGQEKKVRVNSSVNTGDRIKTGVESAVDIVESGDGSAIRITENGEVEIEEGSEDGNTLASLLDGGIVSNIRKLAGGRKVRIATPTATATIRGTAFSMQYSSQTKEAGLSVFKGVVSCEVGGQAVDVRAGQRVTVIAGKIGQKALTKKDVSRAQAEGGDVLEDVEMPEGEDEDVIEGGEAVEEETGEEEASAEEALPEQPVEEPAEDAASKESAAAEPAEEAVEDATSFTLKNTGGSGGDDEPAPAEENAVSSADDSKTDIQQSIADDGVMSTISNVGGGPDGTTGTSVVKKRKVVVRIYAE